MKHANRRSDSQLTTGARSLTRRDVLTTAAAVVGAAGLPRAAWSQTEKVVKKGRIKQSICKGCLRKMKISREEEAAIAAKMGLLGLDLVGRGDWDAVKKHGLVATMVSGAGSIRKGLNDKSMHPKFLDDFKKNIKAAAEYKWPNVICMAGDRKGISDEEGMENCRVIEHRHDRPLPHRRRTRPSRTG
jgi:hydroxypyruvate isomerase